MRKKRIIRWGGGGDVYIQTIKKNMRSPVGIYLR